MTDSSLLLEEIRAKSNCLFLSDLHLPEKKRAILKAIGTILPNCYSAPGWKHAAAYITMNNCSFKKEEEIRTFLTGYLTEAD